jgi:hypothetical protein
MVVSDVTNPIFEKFPRPDDLFIGQVGSQTNLSFVELGFFH